MSQKISTDSLLIKALANDQLLPILINSAQKFSPDVKRMSANVEYSSANQRISRNAIFSSFSFLSSYHYGTNYSAVTEFNAANSFTTVQTGFYNIGVGLQLPLSLILNRRHLLKSTQSQLEMAQFDKENSNLYVKQQVIRYYQELKLSHRLMVISSSNRQAAQINFKLGEKEFMQGQLSVGQYSTILDIFNKAKIEYETNLNRFQTSLMQLDAYTGVSFSTLLNQVK
ncbi:TolC family protein [Emticicia aquatica]|nr:TolC family protein [Emticicia aquatica]